MFSRVLTGIGTGFALAGPATLLLFISLFVCRPEDSGGPGVSWACPGVDQHFGLAWTAAVVAPSLLVAAVIVIGGRAAPARVLSLFVVTLAGWILYALLLMCTTPF